MTDVAATTLNDTTVTPFAGPSAWRRHRVTPRRSRPRCGAKSKQGNGAPCMAPVVWDDERDAPRNGRCRMHGGLSTGPRTSEGRARALANLVQFRDGDQDIGGRRGSRGRKPSALDEILELHEPGKAPRCQCGCLERVRRRSNGNGWKMYFSASCKSRAFRGREFYRAMQIRLAMQRARIAGWRARAPELFAGW